jgi:hypothetical protein
VGPGLPQNCSPFFSIRRYTLQFFTPKILMSCHTHSSNLNLGLPTFLSYLQVTIHIILTLYHLSSSLCQRSRYSDWLWPGRPRGQSSSPIRSKIFFLSTSPISVLGPTQPYVQWVPGAFSPRLKVPGREAGHAPPTNAEVKNTWICTPTPP